MAKKIKVVHYLNQFFGGLGGEEKAHLGPRSMEGPVGPGRAIAQALGGEGEVAGTVICGDNFFAEKTEEALRDILQRISSFRPNLLLAGPAFNAGRYGAAAGEVCRAVQNELKIPSVAAMFEENPGVDLFRGDVYIVRTEDSVKTMTTVIAKMVSIGRRLVAGQPIGRPDEEGYFSRGIIRNELEAKNAADRAVDMLLAKIKGLPYKPELDVPRFERIKPAPPVKDLASAVIALVTDGGLVPKGNPDHLESNRSTRFGAYRVAGLDTLDPSQFEANHMGYDNATVNQDPNRLVPLDVAREFEKKGIIGKVHDWVYTTAGVATALDKCSAIGRGIANRLVDEGVSAVILTST
jgi:glycine reductase